MLEEHLNQLNSAKRFDKLFIKALRQFYMDDPGAMIWIEMHDPYSEYIDLQERSEEAYDQEDYDLSEELYNKSLEFLMERYVDPYGPDV